MRTTVQFRCSDAAYERLFRRRDGRDGSAEEGRGERFDRVLTRFLDEIDREIKESEEHRLVLYHQRSDVGTPRELTIDAEIKERFDRVAETAPVARDVLFREAIWRATGLC